MYEWLDEKYILLCSNHLALFKRKDKVFNFRCPFCGDSQTNKHKARGYIFNRGKGYRFFCHNCQQSLTIPNFLQAVDPTIFAEYWKERLVAKQSADVAAPVEKFAPPRFYNETPLRLLKKISQLPPEHGARKFVDQRLIPSKAHWRLYYCSKFQHWVNTFVPDKFPNPIAEHRLIIPVFDRNSNLVAVQGRRLSGNGPKYYTISLDNNAAHLFGVDTLNYEKTIYVVEGPIDSLFIPNCVAALGGVITRDLDSLGVQKNRIVLIYDNEPRNGEINKQVARSIRQGYNVVIWPHSVTAKDINEMILQGELPEQVLATIQENTYSGLEAEARLAEWRKR